MAAENIFKEINLYNALDNNTFRVYFQPQVHLTTGQVLGASALSRYVSREGNVHRPSQYIGYFEETGFIRNLDLFVFEEVCMFQSKWRSYFGEKLYPMTISVNFSRTWFNERAFIPALQGILAKYDAKPELIEIEISGYGAVKSPQSFKRVFNELKQIGFRCSIDDFGKTEIPDTFLNDIDADSLKISRSFINECHINDDKEAKLRQIIEHAETLGMDVVAIGAETEEDLDFLKELGCRCVQGFVFSEPMPKAQFVSFVKERDTGDED